MMTSACAAKEAPALDTSVLGLDSLDELDEVPEAAPLRATSPAPSHRIDCEQSYGLQATSDHPFVWDQMESDNEGADHACRYGCRITPREDRASASRLTLSLQGTGELAIRSTRPEAIWTRMLAADKIVAPTQVRWTSWCGDAITIALHDLHHVRIVSLASATGDIVDDFTVPIGTVQTPDPSFTLQMHCWDRRTAVHARGDNGAWSIDVPRQHDEQPQRVPTEVFERLNADTYYDFDAEASPKREVRRTQTRKYQRVDDELFAYDLKGRRLWKQAAQDPLLGCLDKGQMLGLVGCSRCPDLRMSLTTVGEYAFIDSDYPRSSTHVFDRDGKHIVYIAR